MEVGISPEGTEAGCQVAVAILQKIVIGAGSAYFPGGGVSWRARARRSLSRSAALPGSRDPGFPARAGSVPATTGISSVGVSPFAIDWVAGRGAGRSPLDGFWS